MPRFILEHRHRREECRAAFAAWNGFDSPLRSQATMASCANGGHGIYWTVTADDDAAARALLPPFVAERTEIAEVEEVLIP